MILEAMEGLNETDSFAVESEAGFEQSKRPSLATCTRRNCPICTGAIAFGDVPVSHKGETAV
jgi:hypothetical protein